MMDLTLTETPTLDLPSATKDSCSTGSNPSALSGIYNPEKNIAIWKRSISTELSNAVDDFVEHNNRHEISIIVTPENVLSELEFMNESKGSEALLNDIALLVDMFCCLFELKKVGLRLTTLSSAMCPKFHVDRVPCRLVTTYSGVATEWLPNIGVDRDKLGHGSQGKPDSESGLYPSEEYVQQLSQGDVALLKGENWIDNSGSGLIHRSPTLPEGERRLLLTLDFYD